MSESNVTLGLTQEDQEALALLREQKKAADLKSAREKRLKDFMNGEATKEYANELLSHGLQADLDANPHLLDSSESLSYAANVALRNYKASLTKKEEQTPQKETQTQTITPPLTPQGTAPMAQTTNQEQPVSIATVSAEELVSKHGYTMAQAAVAKAFPPKFSATN
jgi:hypothetical protein